MESASIHDTSSYEYMTVKEVADVLRKHPVTIYRWLEAGKVFVGAKKFGQNWFIPRHEVLRSRSLMTSH